MRTDCNFSYVSIILVTINSLCEEHAVMTNNKEGLDKGPFFHGTPIIFTSLLHWKLLNGVLNLHHLIIKKEFTLSNQQMSLKTIRT